MTDQLTNSTAAGGTESAFPLVLGLDTFGDRTNTADGRRCRTLRRFAM
jgi:hypothetical protein